MYRGECLRSFGITAGSATAVHVLQEAFDAALADKEARRNTDYVGHMVWSQQLRATEYFSRWIELKEHTAYKAGPA